MQVTALAGYGTHMHARMTAWQATPEPCRHAHLLKVRSSRSCACAWADADRRRLIAVGDQALLLGVPRKTNNTVLKKRPKKGVPSSPFEPPAYGPVSHGFTVFFLLMVTYETVVHNSTIKNNK